MPIPFPRQSDLLLTVSLHHPETPNRRNTRTLVHPYFSEIQPYMTMQIFQPDPLLSSSFSFSKR